MTTDIDALIEKVAGGAKQTNVGTITIVPQTIPDLIQADRHLARKRVSSNPVKAVMRSTQIPPSHV